QSLGRPDAAPDLAPSSGGKAPIAETYGEGLAALIHRLEGLDRALGEERRSSQTVDARRFGDIEARVERALRAAPVK
ncbi:hypothetical protein ACQJ25_27405, partial [Klebsiella pneumoniae]|uniref:hypothetical protein n=1 Tax=Klebsiella pneumoniae TaxID=573 RepID=UPI003D020659